MTRENHKVNLHNFSLFYWGGGGRCLHVCLYTLYVSSAHRGEEKVSDSLELELEAIVSYHLGGRIRT